MASRLSTTDANNILDVRFGGGTSSVPATYYFALLTTAPTDDAGTGAVEVTGGAYARVGLASNSTNFPAASARSKSNGVAITWPTATASWGTVVGIALYDASTAGTFRGYAALGSSVAVATGATPSIAVGNFTVTA